MEHLIFIFLIGLCVGSFVNVCIYRLPKSKQVLLGRSYCPKCKKKIKWFDNIPVLSYFLLNGKCRSCKKKISSQYLIVELITGLGFLLIFLNEATLGSGSSLRVSNLIAFEVSSPEILITAIPEVPGP